MNIKKWTQRILLTGLIVGAGVYIVNHTSHNRKATIESRVKGYEQVSIVERNSKPKWTNLDSLVQYGINTKRGFIEITPENLYKSEDAEFWEKTDKGYAYKSEMIGINTPPKFAVMKNDTLYPIYQDSVLCATDGLGFGK